MMLDWHLMQDCFSGQEMRQIWSESTTISTWIRIEQALAHAQYDIGLIPKEAVDALDAFSIANLDRDQMHEDMLLVGRPIVGLVKQIRDYVGPDLAPYIHVKSTTQDIMDSALSVQMKLGLQDIQGSIERIIRVLDRLIEEHRETRIIGRTNGQHAIPMLLSTKLQCWHSELVRRNGSMTDAAERGLNIQLGGPVGDLSNYNGMVGQKVKSRVAKHLGLGTIEPHWQNSRDALADIVTTLGTTCATLCKIAHNVNLLSSTDIAEVSEIHTNGKGASSSMGHKRNQRASEFAEAVARLGRQRSEQIGELSLHQHERSGGVWIGEWVVIPEVFLLTSGALAWSEKMLTNLQFDVEVMTSAIAATGDAKS